MADDDVEEAPPPQAAPAPAIQSFQDSFTHPVAQEWAQEVGTRLNDYFQRRDIADASERAGQNFVNNLDQFKTGLTSMVQNDPNAVHTALDIVPPTVRALTSTLPGGIDNLDDHHAAVTDHIQQEIAAAAVTSAAEHHEDMARGMLEHPRISELLGDNAGPLDTYISIQAQARAADNQAQVEELQRAGARRVDQSMTNYAGALVDPSTGGVRFPDGWNQGIMADPRLPPSAKVAMAGMYDTLHTNGDAPQSDPWTVSKLVEGIASGMTPSVPDVLGEAGHSLKLQDAMMLTNLPKEGAIQLHNALEQGRNALATPENGQAGEEAFAKYANWLLPAARNGAVLDPSSPDYVLPPTRLNGFAPTAANMVDVAYRQPVAERRQLSEIFSNPEYRKPARAARGPEPGPGDFEVRVPSGAQMNQQGQFEPAGTAEGHNPNRAPFTGVQPLSNDQAINPAGVDRDATGKLLREVATDTGSKALGAADLAASTSRPAPVPRQAIQTEAEKAAILGNPRVAASRNANARYRPSRRK